jgi:hypothetical protein
VSDRRRSEEERLGAAGWEPWHPHDWRSVRAFWRDPGDGLWHAQKDALASPRGREPGERRARARGGWLGVQGEGAQDAVAEPLEWLLVRSP